MLFLSNTDPKSDVHFYINSPGGSVSAVLAVFDTMQYMRCDVATYCVGMAADMSAVLLVGGQNGKRYVLPSARVLLHQPMIGGVMEGSAADLAIEAEEIVRTRQRLYEIIAAGTGRDLATIETDCDRNKWLDAQEAIDYGIADTVLKRVPDEAEG